MDMLPNNNNNGLLSNEAAVSKLKNIVLSHIDSSVDAEKTEQYYEIRRNELYYDGQQYAVPGITSSGYVDYLPSGGASNLSPSSSQDSDSLETDVTNIFKGDARKFVSLIGQRPPNINCTAAISDNHSHQVRARIADTIAPLLHDLWDTQYSHMRVVFSVGIKGTTFIYTPFVTDGDRYGYTEIPQYGESSIEIGPPSYSCPSCGSEGVMPMDAMSMDVMSMNHEEMCPDCGDPNVSIEPPPTTSIMTETGSERFPNGAPECHILSGLEITTPFHITDISEAPWLRYEMEYDRHKLMTAYPHISEKIRNSSGSGGPTSEYGRNVREQSSSYAKRNYNSSRSNKIRYARYWIRPSEYVFWHPNEIISIQSQTTLSEALGDESLQAASVSMQQVAFSQYLRENYPDGIKLTFVGDHLADIESESMDDVFSAIPPEAAETMYPRAYLEDAIALQDRVNDYTEIAHESAERSIPFIIANPNILNPKTINRLGRRVSEFIFSEPGSAGNFGNAFYKFSPSEVRNDLMDFVNQNIRLSREIYGITDAIFGGGPSHATLGEAEIDRNQALMILGSPWFFMRRGWARAFRNGIMQVARKSSGVLHFPRHSDYHGEGVPLPIGYEELAAGGWKCEADEAMPLSAAQLRTWLERMFQLDPALGDRLGMFHPDNLGRMQDVIGVSGWAIPENKERLAVLDVIERLSQQAPVPLPDPMTGQTIPQSSEPPDPYLHDPQLASRFIRDWLLSDDGKSLQQENPEGWQNVFLYGKALYEMTLPPPPPPEEGGPPPQEPVGELLPPEEIIPETALPPAEPPLEEQMMIQ
jgi:hypothetical protein